ncbi:RipA family octameric membrane protein [Cellulomonas phragmiteti]|uniref:Membrane protein n=1 Tax=Cellulomonas phragmiteti TaxID=478780 RepID=A0ABQ4DN17_9CELL|nr:hypothetical protein [Cellulomonas phragmiteti]GIG40736.1 membrane protein [Cellulomonas phragmiteti]
MSHPTEGRDPATLDQYKLAAEMADRVSARRGNANTYFVSLQSALVAVLGFLTAGASAPDRWVLVAVCSAGLVTATTWYLLLRSYRDLNRAKYEVICRIEAQLPHQVFSDEWISLKRDPVKWWRPRYAELGTVERVVPLAFAGLNVALGYYIGWG